MADSDKIKEKYKEDIARIENLILRGNSETYIRERFNHIPTEILEEVIDSSNKKRKEITASKVETTSFRNIYPTVEELKKEDIPEIRWLIKDFLASSGFFLLSAKPKTGKTFLALQMAVAVATGKPFLDHFETEKGKVLYVITQGGKRLMKDRILKVENGTKLDNMFYQTALNPLENGGYEELTNFIEMAKNPKLIVLDMITGLLPNHKHSNYAAWQATTDRLNDFTLKNDICLLGVYHSKKGETDSEDFFEDSIGSTGINAGISGGLMLRNTRNKNESVIQMKLRELTGGKKTLLFEDAKWSYVAGELPNRMLDREIYDILKEQSGLTNSEIATATGKNRSNVYNVLKRLVDENFIYQEKGKYFIK